MAIDHDSFLWELKSGRGPFHDKIKLRDHGGGVSLLVFSIPNTGVFSDKWNSSYGGEFKQKLGNRYHGSLKIKNVAKYSANENRTDIVMSDYIALPITSEMPLETVAHIFKLLRKTLFAGDIMVAITTTQYKMRRARLLFKNKEDLIIWEMIWEQYSVKKRDMWGIEGETRLWALNDIRATILNHPVPERLT